MRPALVVLSLLPLSLAMTAGAGTGPSPIQPEIDKLRAVENVLLAHFNHLDAVLLLPPDDQLPVPELVNQLDAIAFHMALQEVRVVTMVDSRLGVPPIDLLPATLMGVLTDVQTAASGILERVSAGFGMPPNDHRLIDALAGVEANALSLLNAINGYRLVGASHIASEPSAIVKALEPQSHQQARAIVIHPPSFCALLDGDGGVVTTTNTMIVQTPSKKGSQMLKCRVKGVANGTGHAVHFDAQRNPLVAGQPCFVLGEPTLRWHETISASGNAVLVCHLP